MPSETGIAAISAGEMGRILPLVKAFLTPLERAFTRESPYDWAGDNSARPSAPRGH